MHRVDRVLERITQPPPSPVAAKILEVTQDERAGARALAEVIAKDQAFTVRVLRIVNSAYYGLQQRVTTVSRAVAVLGFDTIRTLALTLYTLGAFQQDKNSIINLEYLWEHSLGCATGARRITARVGHTPPEEAFVAGLLHDMGKVLFYQYFKKEFIEAVKIAEEEGISLSEAETRILGTDHATAGEAWARKWNLPFIIQHAMRFHHHPLLLPEAVDASVRQTVAIVHIADLFCEASQIGKGGDNGYEPIEEEIWSLLAVGEEECRALLEPVMEEVQKTKELFGLTSKRETPAKQDPGRTSDSRFGPQQPPPSGPPAIEETGPEPGQKGGHPSANGQGSGDSPVPNPRPALGGDSFAQDSLAEGLAEGPAPQELLAKFSYLMEAGKHIALLAGLEDLWPNIASQAQTLMEADAASILVPQEDSLEVIEAVGLNSLMGTTIPAEGSLAGWVARMGEPMVLANIAEASHSWEKEFFGPIGYLSHLLLPVEWAGKRIAVLSVHSRRRRQWSPQEVSLFNTFAGLVAVAMENAQLYREAEDRAITLQKLNHKLEEALSLRKNFLAIVSHELRTPLQVIMGYTQLISANTLGQPTPRMTKALDKILKEADHLLTMINSLLDLSQIEVGRITLHPKPVDLTSLLDEAAAHTTTLLQNKPIVLRCHYNHNLPTLFIDPERLKQILEHLLDNAVKFTREGEIVLRASPQTQGVEIIVRDTGIGMQVEDQKVIFEGFRQLEDPHTRRYGGIGVGLYLVRCLVELLGGRIEVESEAGRGSTFRVWVPSRPST
jgi:signal transduction histidine kinase/HD-like signal output (HDOD) protein